MFCFLKKGDISLVTGPRRTPTSKMFVLSAVAFQVAAFSSLRRQPDGSEGCVTQEVEGVGMRQRRGRDVRRSWEKKWWCWWWWWGRGVAGTGCTWRTPRVFVTSSTAPRIALNQLSAVQFTLAPSPAFTHTLHVRSSVQLRAG